MSIRFCSFGGTWQRFCGAWWNDLARYVCGGWLHDVQTFWHRGRHGWAPRDTWSLDSYLNVVLAGTLAHLAAHSHGAPGGYSGDDTEVNAEKWAADLKRWAQAFSEDPEDVEIYDKANGYAAQRAEEERRREAIHQALRELEPWWDALWD